jgi:hypothetical protein
VNVTRETTNRNQDPLNSATETLLGGAQTPASKTAEALHADAAETPIGRHMRTIMTAIAHPATPSLRKDVFKSAEEPTSGPCPLQYEVAARQMAIGSLGT